MNNTFFSSDMHFRHKNIIKYSNRPFTDMDDMREGLIQRHNERVKPGDTWFHLGDFAFADEKYVREVLLRMNGIKIFLRGNHDNENMFFRLVNEGLINGFLRDWIGKINDLSFHMYHFPIQSWENARHGTIHLHGHSHGSTPSPNMLRLDVGVDCHNWYPISYDEVADWAKKTRENIDPEKLDPGRDGRMK
jgi:calcineurin-like phosphoesterase family protein